MTGLAAQLVARLGKAAPGTSHGYLDEQTKTGIRKAVLKAVCIPGYQVPYVSEELPVARGFGTGGLQVTLAMIGASDVLKVIDEGDDGNVNAVNLRGFVAAVTGTQVTASTAEATIIQTRHRIPEAPLKDGQTLVLQAAFPCPLRFFEPTDAKTRHMHAQKDYGKLWLRLYESVVEFGEIMIGTRYPVFVNERYAAETTPIPRWDLKKLDRSPALAIFGAGREKRIWAIPPYTPVEPIAFDDFPFRPERFEGKACARCASTDTFLVPLPQSDGTEFHICSDTSLCREREDAREKGSQS
jgi:alpha-D-ribose 1-methylphosphonate 5-phosphate C-P lyase